MPRSHPPTLLKITARTLAEACCLTPGTRVLVAVSGGADSVALLHVLSLLAGKFSLDLRAHAVDHGLRPEAAQEVALVAELAARLAVPFGSSKLALVDGGNLQERARDARYAALRAAADDFGGALLATAHHVDDRAETVLLRLLRGAGVRGLGVLPAQAGRLLRPFVRASKSDILTHLQRHDIAHAEDPSNRDTRFLRVRVRHELLPLLRELSPQIVQHLAALADEALAGSGAAGPNAVGLGSVKDEEANPVPLGRAQAEQLERARRLGQRATCIPLANGLEVRFDPTVGDFVAQRRSENSSTNAADRANVRKSARLGPAEGSR